MHLAERMQLASRPQSRSELDSSARQTVAPHALPAVAERCEHALAATAAEEPRPAGQSAADAGAGRE
jgi:hypothetical protein